MNNLIKTQNSDILKPYDNTVSLGKNDFYYIQTGFLKLDLTDVACSALRSDPIYSSIDSCKRIINDTQSSPEQISNAFQRALCDNKSAAVRLQTLQSQIHSATQGLDDTREYYNITMIQNANLAAGIVLLLGGTLYYFNKSSV